MSWWLAVFAALVGFCSCGGGFAEEWCERHDRGRLFTWTSAGAAFVAAEVWVLAVMP